MPYYMGIEYKDPQEDKTYLRKIARERSTIGKVCSQAHRNYKCLTNGTSEKIFWSTYLAYLLKKNIDPKESYITIEQDKTKPLMAKYEAFLTQCCYVSRMAYCSADVYCRMTKFLDYSPDGFNDMIEIIEDVYENKERDTKLSYKCSFNSVALLNDPNYKNLFEVSDELPEKIKGSSSIKGKFFQNTRQLGAYIYLHHNPNSKINSEKTLFVSFKAATNPSAFLDILKKMTKIQLLPQNFESNNKNKLRVGDIYNKILQQDDALSGMIKTITELSSDVDQIVITGHSLGGSLASLFGFYLKYSTRSTIRNKRIHIITFGEPKAFYDISRKMFNSKLSIDDVPFTYDSVRNYVKGISARGDIFVNQPLWLKHPGYNLLLKETYAFSKTGRTNEIRELRALMGYVDEKGDALYKSNRYLTTYEFRKLFENFDPSYQYPAYYQNYANNTTASEEKFKNRLKTGSGNIKQKQQMVKEIALTDIKRPQVYPSGYLLKSISQKQDYVGGEGDSPNSLSQAEKEAEAEYDRKTLEAMPSAIYYDCYAKLCNAIYMGVNYYNVLRFAKNNPTENFDLVDVDGRLYSRSEKGTDKCDNSSSNSGSRVNNSGKNRNSGPKNSGKISNSGPKNSGSSNSSRQTSNSSSRKNTRNNSKPKSNSFFGKIGSFFTSPATSDVVSLASTQGNGPKKSFCSIL